MGMGYCSHPQEDQLPQVHAQLPRVCLRVYFVAHVQSACSGEPLFNMEYAIVPYSLNNPFTDVKKLAQRVIHVAGREFAFDQPSEGSADPTAAGFGARIFNCEIVLAHFLSEHSDLVAFRAALK